MPSGAQLHRNPEALTASKVTYAGRGTYTHELESVDHLVEQCIDDFEASGACVGIQPYLYPAQLLRGAVQPFGSAIAVRIRAH